MIRSASLYLATLVLCVSCAFADEAGRAIVKQAIEHSRDSSSHFRSSMTIHRPSWERKSVMEGWTKGNKLTLVRFIEPAKDAGNGSLTLDDEMWTYSPKVNRIIQVPPSMKAQSWMGSDFSYQDLSKADDIIDQYDHRIVGKETIDGMNATIVESIPHESAPVVWGKERLAIQDDGIMIRHGFYDQSGKLIKQVIAREIKVAGGKKIATVLRMENLEKADEWTEVQTQDVQWKIEIPDSYFTQSNLQNPRGLGR